MKYKILLLVAMVIVSYCWGQKNVVYSIDRYFNTDTVYGKTEEGYTTKYFKIDIDSSNWRLYRITKDTFYYFKIYGYGTQQDVGYPADSLIKWKKLGYFTMSGWSDAMAYYEKSYMKTGWLLYSSKVSDTIPEECSEYSEFINADNPNAQYGHTILKYYVGGCILGEFVREKHLNDGKKKPKNKNQPKK